MIPAAQCSLSPVLYEEELAVWLEGSYCANYGTRSTSYFSKYLSPINVDQIIHLSEVMPIEICIVDLGITWTLGSK